MNIIHVTQIIIQPAAACNGEVFNAFCIQTYVGLEHFVSRGDCLLQQVGWGDVWPGRQSGCYGNLGRRCARLPPRRGSRARARLGKLVLALVF